MDMNIDALKIKIFLDGADIKSIKSAARDFPFIKGFTTNPTLMRKAGVEDYKGFALRAIDAAGGLPISFEVFSDDFDDMERQAGIIASWSENAYVKIPITNTKGEPSVTLIKKLSANGIKLNITAILATGQVFDTAQALDPGTPAIVSVFAGRIADTGRDPIPVMRECLSLLSERPQAELLWASPREPLNIFQADAAGVPIITATRDVIAKLKLAGRDLAEFSLDTVRMFYNDAQAAGYKL
jgi:transaldolase